MYDIIIVGGSVAGSCVARLLANNYKILIIDRRDLQKEEPTKDKCCGGLISEEAQKMFACMGLSIPKSVLVTPQIFCVRTIDLETGNDNYYQKHYLNINRSRLDAYLLSLVSNKINFIEGTFHSYYENENAITVTFFKNGEKYTEKCRYLIGADGASSAVKKQNTTSTFSYKYIAIQEYFKIKEPQPFYTALFDKNITNFYSWTIPKDNYLILGSALHQDNNVFSKFNLLKEKLKKYNFDFSSPIKRNGAVIIRPRKISEISTGSENVFLIGEAAGFISPSSSEGLSYAFKSAIALSQAFLQNTCDISKQYSKNINYIKRTIFMRNLKSPIMFNSFLRNMAIKSNLLSLNIL